MVNLLFNLVGPAVDPQTRRRPGLSTTGPSTVWTLRVLASGLAGAALYLVGLFGTNVLGRRLLKGVEIWLEKIGVRRGLSGHRQLAGLRAGGRQTFRRCVLVEFPRTGVFTLGFVSNRRPSPWANLRGIMLRSMCPTPNPHRLFSAFRPGRVPSSGSHRQGRDQNYRFRRYRDVGRFSLGPGLYSGEEGLHEGPQGHFHCRGTNLTSGRRPETNGENSLVGWKPSVARSCFG